MYPILSSLTACLKLVKGDETVLAERSEVLKNIKSGLVTASVEPLPTPPPELAKTKSKFCSIL